jgi:hypothetical protein
MHNPLRLGPPQRQFLGLAAVFLSILGVYGIAYLISDTHSIGITLAYTGLLVVYLMRRWRSDMSARDAQLRELTALASVAPLRIGPGLPMTDMALDGAELSWILSYILKNGAESIVECGSGMSTLVIGNLLKSRGGGRLFSLEEDEAWFGHMQHLVGVQELGDFVTVLHAPIRAFAGGEGWYDSSVASEIVKRTTAIDLLLIDGPRSKAGQSRYQALGYFRPVLNQSSLVLLHDCDREAEHEVLNRWMGEFGLTYDRISRSSRGLAAIRFAAAVSPSEPRVGIAGP